MQPNPFVDPTCYLYLLLLAFSGFIFVVLLYGVVDARLRGVRRYGAVYVSLMLLSLSIFYIHSIHLYSRVGRYYGFTDMDTLLSSPYWWLRLVPEAAVLGYISLKMYRRFKQNRQMIRDINVAEGDNSVLIKGR